MDLGMAGTKRGFIQLAVGGLIILGMVACAPSAPGASNQTGADGVARQTPKTLVALVGNEPSSMAHLPLLTEGASFAGLQTVQSFANANLLYKDDQLVVR